ncbi:hypothetical protein [Haloferula sargassicola]|uniref:Uncharacterized protein n=1 Tax=Haloferula sargassicola TaxID=490096 RepID=A0ABP9USG2_9BACT
MKASHPWALRSSSLTRPAISRRRALTEFLRPRFEELSQLLPTMDRLVLRFRKTEAGTRFADSWKAARLVRDLGQAAAPEPHQAVEPTP